MTNLMISTLVFVFVFAVIRVQNFGIQKCYDLKNGQPILFR